MPKQVIKINRAPVLTLWATVVAEHLGYDQEEALTLGKAVAGLNAQSKGRRLGIFKPGEEKGKKPKERKRGEEFWVDLCGRPVPAIDTSEGIRAVVGDKPIDPDGVRRYLHQKFKDDLGAAREAMSDLAGQLGPQELADESYNLYTKFRPSIPSGKRGWGAAGDLDLALIRSLG